MGGDAGGRVYFNEGALKKPMDILNESKRKENERKFGKWEELRDGRRRYSYEIK